MKGEPVNARVVLMLGDPAGIGPELVARFLDRREAWEGTTPVIVGDRRSLAAGCRVAGVSLPEARIVGAPGPAEAALERDGKPVILDLPLTDPMRIPMGAVSVEAGKVTLQTLLYCVDLCRAGAVDGFVFAPLNKEAMIRAGLEHSSELELFKEHFVGHSALEEINILDAIWALRVTSHIPLRAVADLIKTETVLRSIRFLAAAMRARGEGAVRIAVAALNPHAGENGHCGREEIDEIEPAIRAAQKEGIDAEGPFPADTVFLRVRGGEFNGLLSMYHDQGQIATKLIGFSRGVTYHAGFPVPITTPAHGTAFDITGKGTADLEPTIHAYRIAARIAERLGSG